MKKFTKQMGKAMILLFLLACIILFFGVMIPEETYRQKDGVIHALVITNAHIVDVREDKIISGKQMGSARFDGRTKQNSFTVLEKHGVIKL